MSDVYDRPFHPVELDAAQLERFPTRAMIEQLRREETMESSGRASLTLVHGEGLTAVLTVAAAGTRFDDHQAGGPTFFIVLDGRIAIVPATSHGAPVALQHGDAFALGPHVRHVIEAESDCAFFTVIGDQDPAA